MNMSPHIHLVAACLAAALPALAAAPSTKEIEARCHQVLTAAVQQQENPAVRAGAVEALQVGHDEEALPWIRLALADKHPVVRFAACVAVGRLEDEASRHRIDELVEDADPNVRVAALFARHRLGDVTLSGRMVPYLLEHREVGVRRNAAMVFGFLGEEGAVKMLARAMGDGDADVRRYALEGMARLGNEDACEELVFMTNAGIGSEEAFAVLALGKTGNRKYREVARYKLQSGTHLETRLAAADALGRLGSKEGYDLAHGALRTRGGRYNDPDDPTANQEVRARMMAITALGSIGRRDAVPALMNLLDEDDPRLRVAAAQALLKIVRGGG